MGARSLAARALARTKLIGFARQGSDTDDCETGLRLLLARGAERRRGRRTGAADSPSADRDEKALCWCCRNRLGSALLLIGFRPRRAHAPPCGPIFYDLDAGSVDSKLSTGFASVGLYPRNCILLAM